MLGIGLFLGHTSRIVAAAPGALRGLVAGSSGLSGALRIGLAGQLGGSSALSGRLAIGLAGSVIGATALTGDFSSIAPNTPTLTITSSIIDNTPDFALYGDFFVNDVIQFETQTAGAGWSAPTTSTHTVTSGELAGANISLGLSAFANGNYEARLKYRRPGSPFSAYSNVVAFTIAVPSAAYVWRATQNGNSDSNGTDIVDYTVDIGPAAADKVILIAASVAQSAATLAMTIDPSGANTPLTLADLYQPSGGTTMAWCYLSVPALANQHTFRMTTSGAAWINRDISVWTLTGLASQTPKVVGRHSVLATNTITLAPGDKLFAMSCDFGGRTFDGSTEAPALGGGADHASGSYHSSADWSVQGGYPSDGFSIVASSAAFQTAIAFG